MKELSIMNIAVAKAYDKGYNDGLKQGEKKSIDDLTQQEAMDIAVAKCFEQGEQKGTPCDTCKKTQPSHSCQDITALRRCALEKQSEQNPAWSEEDEIALGNALWCCKQAASIAKDENDIGNAWYAEDWLKSIKERYTWKPSDEQIKALEEVVNSHWNPDGDTLWHLYEELKKLREKDV